jgi:branched-chain amino acid transport system ATP-binding protein
LVDTNPMLQVKGLKARYGEAQVLNGVTLEIFEGEVVSLLGRNGTGKSTTIKAIMGMVAVNEGEIHFRGRAVTGYKPHSLARLGLGYVPEERRIFGSLSVFENLEIVAGLGGTEPWSMERVLDLFPVLGHRKKHMGKQLSGGEQQMLAMARVLRQGGRLLLLDEPTEGLAPIVVKMIGQVIKELKDANLTVLLVEQNLLFTMDAAVRHYIISKGKTVFSGETEALKADVEVQKRYLTV